MKVHNYRPLVQLSIVLLLLLVTCNSYSQSRDSLLAMYNSQTIHTLGRMYVKGSRQLTFRDLKSEFQANLTRGLYKKSKGNLVFSRFLRVTSVAAMVTGAIIKKDNKGSALAFTIVGVGLNLSSFYFRKQSSELLERALWLRNRNILFGVRE